jgi:hypothetical protein
MKNKFLTFLNPYLSYIDNGNFYRKSFSWLYVFIAMINLITPFYFYYKLNINIYEFNSEDIVIFILLWSIFFLVSWFSFLIWWNRKSKLETIINENDDFFVIPILSHFIQTLGEWLGTWIGIVGFFMPIILQEKVAGVYRGLNIEFLETSSQFGILLMPIYGFIIIVFSRFIAEFYRVLCSIANNTKKN